MTGIWSFFRSSIGLKVIMALTGAALFAFLIGHVAGNLLYFAGRDALNDYSRGLHQSALLLWGARIGLLASVSLHIVAATALYLRERAARPEAYQSRRMRQPSYAARTMKYSGPFVAAFLVFHLLHLTTGAKVAPIDFIPGDAYGNVTASFGHGWLALVYVIAVCLVGLHLSHGAHSMFESLGLRHPGIDRPLRILMKGITVLIVIGFCSVPLFILFNLVGG